MRNGIGAAAGPRVAAGDAPHAQPHAAACPEPRDRLRRVRRARRLVPATAEGKEDAQPSVVRRDRSLVQVNEPKEEGDHRGSLHRGTKQSRARQRITHVGNHLLPGVRGSARAGGEAEIDPAPDVRELVPKRCADPPRHGVPVDRAHAHVPPDRHGNTRWFSVTTVYHAEGEMGAAYDRPRPLDAVVCPLPAETVRRGEHSRAGAHGEPLPPLPAPPLDHTPTARPAHAGAKPVHACAPALLRLVGAFHT